MINSVSAVRFAALSVTALAIPIGLALQPQPSPAPQPDSQQPPAQGLAGPNVLTDAQKQMLKAAETEFSAKIQPLAERLGRTAKELNRVLLSDKPDPEVERKLSDELADAVSQIVTGAIRLRVAAVHDIVNTLTAEQKKLLLTELDRPDANPDLIELMKKVFAEENK